MGGWHPSTKASNLYFITDPTCCDFQADIDGLLELRNLRFFSWRGLNQSKSGPRNIEGPISIQNIIRKTLANNSDHLETLELEAAATKRISPPLIQVIGENLSPISCLQVTPELTKADLTAKFSSLRHLSLGWISLDSAYEALLPAVCLEQLQTLRLRGCDGTISFLRQMAASGAAINLRYFEVFYRDLESKSKQDTEPIQDVLPEFLGSCSGLKELYIACKISALTSAAAFRNSTTLKRFVLDQLVRDLVHEDQTLINSIPLECIGFSDRPLRLVRDSHGNLLRVWNINLILLIGTRLML